MTTAAVASDWSEGLGGRGLLHFESLFPACPPASLPACCTREEEHNADFFRSRVSK